MRPTVWLAAHERDRRELVDRAAAGDHELRAEAGQLVQLDVRHVRRERVERRVDRVVDGQVLDDDVRGGDRGAAQAVVALRIGRRLAAARVVDRDEAVAEGRLLDGRRRPLARRRRGGGRRCGSADRGRERDGERDERTDRHAEMMADRTCTRGTKRAIPPPAA
ncbi:MAG TPA: hypothetical protein VKB03_13305 [Conexibacter sp.]|nr:hypothetical protein [Conexibacter sp.]